MLLADSNLAIVSEFGSIARGLESRVQTQSAMESRALFSLERPLGARVSRPAKSRRRLPSAWSRALKDAPTFIPRSINNLRRVGGCFSARHQVAETTRIVSFSQALQVRMEPEATPRCEFRTHGPAESFSIRYHPLSFRPSGASGEISQQASKCSWKTRPKIHLGLTVAFILEARTFSLIKKKRAPRGSLLWVLGDAYSTSKLTPWARGSSVLQLMVQV